MFLCIPWLKKSMKLFTAEQAKLADSHAINEMGIPSEILMENAAIRIFIELEKLFGGKVAGKKFAILCGKGNNGGDGLAVARHLLNKKADVKIILDADESNMTSETALNRKILLNLSQAIPFLSSFSSAEEAAKYFGEPDCIVDCLYGVGFRGKIKEPAAKLLILLNQMSSLKIAVDVPSGLSANDGRLADYAFEADYTFTLGTAKLGLFLPPGIKNAGKVKLLDIGLPKVSLKAPFNEGGETYLINRGLAKKLLFPLNDFAHKNTYGKTLIIAGSEEYRGAPLLALEGAMRAGSGFPVLALPDCLKGSVSVPAEAVTIYLPSENGEVKIDDNLAYELARKFKVILAGPGLGRGKTVFESIRNLCSNQYCELILDADALDVIAQEPSSFNVRHVLLTPHLGEGAKLLGKSGKSIEKNYIKSAMALSDKYSHYVLLKSSVSIFSYGDFYCFVNPAANAGMAKAGSGDLLAGIIAGLASKTGLVKAAVIGSYLHSEAGRLAAKKHGKDSMRVSDIAKEIGNAFKRLRS